ncbi:hypothetical protein GCM10023080_074340 [Streptomyces pseudoechinosporeus]
MLRTALASLWLRAALSDPARRRTTLRFAVGITVCQVGWVALPGMSASVRLPGIVVVIVAEVSVPVGRSPPG